MKAFMFVLYAIQRHLSTSCCLLGGSGGRFINDRIASFATFKSLIASISADAVSSKCDRYFRVAKIANRCLEAVLAFHQKSQIAKAPAILAINMKNLRPQMRSRKF